MTARARRELIEIAATELFAERGYHGASVNEIAERSGVSVPVLYDHFESKRALYRRLLTRHFGEMRDSWGDHLLAEGSRGERMSRAIDAWFTYVQGHPQASALLFGETSGDAETAHIRHQAAEESRALLLPVLAQDPAIGQVAGETPEDLDMAWEAIRALLQGLALWWRDHQHVSRSRMVVTAMNLMWIGIERVGNGETWKPQKLGDGED